MAGGDVLAIARYRKENKSVRVSSKVIFVYLKGQKTLKFPDYNLAHKCPLLLLLRNSVIVAEQVIQLN